MKSRLQILQKLTSLTTVPVNLVVAAQSQALAVRAVQNHIYWMSVPLNYRVCSVVLEYVGHLRVAVHLWQLPCTNKDMTELQKLFIGTF